LTARIAAKKQSFDLPLARLKLLSPLLMKPRLREDSKSRLVKLRLDSIRTDAETQTRAHIDDVIVAEYGEAMLRGEDRFNPLDPFDQEIDPELEVVIDGDRVRARGVKERGRLGLGFAQTARSSYNRG
jgi:hypothetical protein